MSVLIKAATAHSVQRFAVPERPARVSPTVSAAELVPVEDPRLGSLRQENAELKAAVAALREAAPEAERVAREAGKREALASAKQDDDKRLALLGDGITAAARSWDERLSSLDALAALLARTALAKLFDQAEDYSDFIARMISRQILQLRRETLTAIRVSSKDFPTEAALVALGEAVGAGSTSIVADPDLHAGDCRVDMQLGHVDLGMRSQWRQLSQRLQEMASEELGA